jgi:hypothetical protein
VVVETGVGIECGYDESAYLYAWSKEGWRRVWQNEQDVYTEKEYRPQTIYSVAVSGWNKGNEYLVLTLGSESWCSSTLHNVYYRAFRLGPDPSAPPLVSGLGSARIDGDPPIRGTVTANDVLVEFDPVSIDVFEPAVRHYRISGSEAKRVDPLALSPASFVTEWLANEWITVAFWSESSNRGSMRDFHDKLKTDNPAGFYEPTLHCSTPDLWQVTMNPSYKATGPTYYFTVRWRPPYRFSMVGVSTVASPSCKEKDPVADEYRTLFPH